MINIHSSFSNKMNEPSKALSGTVEMIWASNGHLFFALKHSATTGGTMSWNLPWTSMLGPFCNIDLDNFRNDIASFFNKDKVFLANIFPPHFIRIVKGCASNS